MERVTLVGAEDVARAGYAISGAGEQMQRAANTIDEATIRHAARLEDLDLRAAQRAEERPTLRDEFAMRAMPSVIRAREHETVAAGMDLTAERAKFRNEIAVAAYEYADAMLKARSA